MHLFLLGAASLLSLRCAWAWRDRAAGAQALPVCAVLRKCHTQPSLGSSLQSRPVQMARGALTLILGEFTALFTRNALILQPCLLLLYFPLFFPQALRVKYLDNRKLKLYVCGFSGFLLHRSPDQHQGGLWPFWASLGPRCCPVLGAECSGRRSGLARKPGRVFAPSTQSLLVF